MEDLRHLFKILHAEWLLRLSVSPNSRHRILAQPVDIAFENGLDVLRRFFRKELPTTLESTFAVMPIFVVCMYKQHEDQHMACWDELFQSIMEWRHTISNIDERKSFVDLMAQLMGGHHQRCLSSLFSDGLRTSECMSCAPDMDPSPRSLSNGNYDFPSSQETQEGSAVVLWAKLDQGKAVCTCLEILEGKLAVLLFYISPCLYLGTAVTYAEILGRSSEHRTKNDIYANNRRRTANEMKQLIISELRRCPQMIRVSDGLNKVEWQIERGLLPHLREVEVALLVICKVRKGRPRVEPHMLTIVSGHATYQHISNVTD